MYQMPSPSMPPKAKHRRSRHGCLLCKNLKIKCDQRRPGCSRCEERNVRCPGYVMRLRWAPKNQLQPEMAAEPMTPNSAGHAGCGSERAEIFGTLDPISTGYSYHDSSWPLGLSSLLGSVGYASQNLPMTLSAPSFPPQAQSLGIPCDDGTAGSMALGAGVSDWGTPGSIPCGDDNDDDNDDDGGGDGGGGGLSEPNVLSRPANSDIVHSTTSAANPYSSGPISIARTQIHKEIACRSSLLVDYFFKEIVSLYCAWDSPGNTMRRLAEEHWQFSPALYHTIQSMAAACLAESFPHLASTAASEHSTAMQCLSSAQVGKEDRTLSMILLGPTSSWHDPSNLAHETLLAARRALDDCREGENTYFFEAALDYWTMMLSFMTDLGDGESCPSRSKRASACRAMTSPHPFTGISQDMIKTLSQVGALVYRHRARRGEAQFITDDDLDFFRGCIKQARHLERQLLLHRPASSLPVQDLADPFTTLVHLEKMDEAYRCTGLLQIYRVFPDLLAERYGPWRDEDVLNVQAEPIPSTKGERDEWLRSFAMYILKILREIPFESRTRCLQPFILITCSSELARSPATEHAEQNRDDLLTGTNIEVMRARGFLQSRLASYRHVLPLRKVSQVQELVEQVWSRLDSGTKNVYWLDVCLENNLVTLPS